MHASVPLSFAVMGAGAVGTYYGGMLALAGAPVTLIGRPALVEAVARDGLAIERDDRRDTVAIGASADVAATAAADVVLVCVKSPDTLAAARALKPHLRPDATVVSLQNGVTNADEIGSVLGQVVLASVVWVGTYMAGPAVVRHTGGGWLELGVTRGCAGRPGAVERARAIAATFERAGVRCPVLDDIDAALWTKLAVNCAFNAVSALGRSRYDRMAASPPVRELMEASVRESVAVARAEGVALDADALIARVWHTAAALPKQYSSTAQDVLRGKPTEIDQLNGHVARRADALGVAAPVNRALHALVKLREAGDDFA